MDILGISHSHQVRISKSYAYFTNALISFLMVSCFLPSNSFQFLQEAIFRTLAAILHLGNIEFSPGKEYDSSVIKDATSSFHLQTAAELFMQVLYSHIHV